MSNSPEFLKAAADIKTLEVRPTNEELLELYGYYKQATEGDCSTARPGMFDLKGKAKWDAWNAQKGTSKEDAERKYIDFVKSVMAKYTN